MLKGLIKCVYCGMSLWAQTLKSGSRLYREQHRSRSHAECLADGRSILCDIPDEKMGRIVSAIVLPDAWMDGVLGQIQLADEVKRVAEERKETEQRLKRLGQVYLDGVNPEGEYQRQKRLLHDRLASLVVPGVDAAREAGRMLVDLPKLWVGAKLSERRKLLLTMLDAVYVDTVEEKSIGAFRPKPEFMPLFQVATTKDWSDVVLINQKPPANDDREAANPCFWWRRERVELYLNHEIIALLDVGNWARAPTASLSFPGPITSSSGHDFPYLAYLESSCEVRDRGSHQLTVRCLRQIYLSSRYFVAIKLSAPTPN